MKFYSESKLTEYLEDCKSIAEFKEKLDHSDDADTLTIDDIDAVEGDVIVVSFPPEYNESTVEFTKLLQSQYPNNAVVAIVNDIDVLIEYADDAIKMLDGMKTKIAAAQKNKPSIILT